MYDSFFKSTLDFFISILSITFLIPILLILYIVVKIDSKGPFLFKQERVGKDRRLFTIYKIRTMTEEASVNSNNKNLEYITTSINDKRITRIGLYLRKFHLDEIPQFINIIKGEMSLIGVRPDAPSQKNDYSESFWKKRHIAKPGITGLSQIKSSKKFFNHRNRNKYDSFYLMHKTKVKLDIYIYMKTVEKIIKGSSY